MNDRHAENVNFDREQWLRVTLSSIGDAVIATDAEGRVRFLNPIAEALTGWKEDEARGQPLPAVFHIINEKTRQIVENPAGKVFETGRIVGLANHTVLIAKDGTERAIDDSAAPIQDADGNIEGVVLVFRDITERRRDEQTTQFLAAIVESSDDAIFGTDVNGIVTSWNRAAERMYGYSADEMIGQPIALIAPPERVDEIPSILDRINRDERLEHFETVRRAKDGRLVPISLTISPIKNKDGEIIGASRIARDISGRERAEKRMQSVVNHVVDGIITIDAKGTVESFNPAAEKIFGYSKSEIIGRNVKILMPEPFRGQHDHYIDNYLRTGEAKIIGIGREVMGKRMDGTIFPMELAVSEFQIGRGRYFTGIVRDITDRKRLEQELRQRLDELADADRRKDHFLATLAHELRNPLAPIQTGLELMRLAQPNSATISEARTIMDRQVKQMKRLVDDLMDVGRITSGKIVLQKEDVDLTDIIRNAVDAIRPLIDEQRQKISVSLPDEPIYLHVDPIRLEQAVSNLLSNASKYTDQEGRIWLAAVQDDAETVITVRDTGIGIDAEQIPSIFEMFSQTAQALDRSQGGLGIGLSLVKSLVDLHGGSVEASSGGAGMGSEFTIRLPAEASVAHNAEEPTKGQEASSIAQRRVILVVEDNHDAANTLAMALQLMGHETHTAYDGLEGIAAAETLRPDVILLDIGLPKINGFEAARHIRAQEWGKQIRLIALSGWGQDDDKQRANEAGFDHHLTKPVETSTLQALLASADHQSLGHSANRGK